jgi:hypothetical protein
MRDTAIFAGTVIAMEILRWWAGAPVAFVVGIAGLSFCIGVFWGAGATNTDIPSSPEGK